MGFYGVIRKLILSLIHILI